VLHMHRMISGAQNLGEDWRVPNNVAERAHLPSPKQMELTVPEAPEVLRLIHAARNGHNPVMGEILHVAALTGLRAGDFCDPTFSAVNLERARINARQPVKHHGSD
jgi:hypothetical protein